MRQEFLRQVAEVYLEKHGHEMRDLLFVFPNRRSSVFFQRYLGEQAGMPVFTPDITTINSLFGELSGLAAGDRLELLYELYKIYTRHITSCTESFDEFLYWGDTILNDFDDIDKYLVDAESLFANITDLKEIDDRYSYLSQNQRNAISEFWGNLLSYIDGEKEQSFMEIWRNMYRIYCDFRKTIAEKGLAYEGMIYRKVAENLLEREQEGCPFSHDRKSECRGHECIESEYIKGEDETHGYGSLASESRVAVNYNMRSGEDVGLESESRVFRGDSVRCESAAGKGVDDCGSGNSGKAAGPDQDRAEAGRPGRDEEDVAFRKLDTYRKVVFVGLNALNKCEKVLLDVLKKEGKACFSWDYFGDIIRNPENKSSFFMDENIIRYKDTYPLSEDGGRPEKQNIEVIGVPSMVGQAKYVAEIIEKEILQTAGADGQPRKENDVLKKAFDTAIVLPDEKLLMPVLNSIPETIPRINVTMGYSLSNTNCASFMNLYSQLYLHSVTRNGRPYFYFRNVRDLLNHPYVLSGSEEAARKIKAEIIKSNRIYVDDSIFSGDELIESLFCGAYRVLQNAQEWKDGKKGTEYDVIRDIAQAQYELLGKLHGRLDSLEGEFIYHYHAAITRMLNLNLPISMSTYFRLLRETVNMCQIPFKGEPLSGLQIMGNLEMRALDFRNLIILSVNEGIFPSHSVSNSMIPYNLRVGFELPDYEYQDAISAYHFYRSIYRAENIYLIYDTRTGGSNTGEVSRFVKQLKYQHGADIRESIVNYHIPSPETEEKVQEKTPEMVETLKKMYYSASSVNTYLDCPLKFYFQNVEGMRDEDDVMEDIEANVFGLLYHSIMQDLYTPFVNRTVTEQDIDRIISGDVLIKQAIKAAFLKCAQIHEIEGKNKIIEALLYKFVTETLKYDRTLCPFQYIAAEKECLAKWQLPDSSQTVRLKGYIDRIDLMLKNGSAGKEREEQLRIIDYKTGKSEIRYREPQEMFDKENETRPYTALQLMFYYLLLREDTLKRTVVPHPESTVLAVYSLKTLVKREFPTFMTSAEELEEFEKQLGRTFMEIFDQNVPFTQTADLRKCEYCPFRVICKR